MLKQHVLENLQSETAWEISILTAFLPLPLFFLVLRDNGRGSNEYLYYARIFEQINEEIKEGGMNRRIDEYVS